MLTAAGDPIPDAAVLLQGGPRFGTLGITRSDAEGSFRFPWPLAGRGTHRVVALRARYAPGFSEVAPSAESVTVWLEPGRTAHGRVVDARTNAAIPGATVKSALADLVLARTTEDGRFDVNELPEKGGILVAADGYAIREVPLDGPAGFLEIGLEGGGPLRGRVLWADTRAPVPQATVGVSATEPDRSNLVGHRLGLTVETGPAGHFTMEGLVSDEPIEVFAYKGAASTKAVFSRLPEAELVLELERPAWMPIIQVRVLDEGGGPVEGALVSWSRQEAPGLWSVTSHPVPTDEDGLVEISAHENVSRDVFMAAGTDEAFGALEHPVTFTERGERPVTIVVEPTVTLDGKLHLPEGAGWVRVSLWSTNATGAPLRISTSISSGHGSFELEAIRASGLTVVVEGEAITPVLHEMSGLGPIRLRVETATEVAGRVTHSDGAGVAGLSIVGNPDHRWQTFLQRPQWTARTDAAGRFTLRGLPPCTRTIVARASEPGRRASVEHRPGDGDVHLTLPGE